jgi:hypothetical protein
MPSGEKMRNFWVRSIREGKWSAKTGVSAETGALPSEKKVGEGNVFRNRRVKDSGEHGGAYWENRLHPR